MTVLVKDLKKEHQILLGEIYEIAKPGITMKSRHNKLNELKKVVISHIEKEDNELYSVLRKVSEENADLKRTLEIFASEMEEITKNVFSFFEKYEHLEEDNFNFSKDYGKIIALLKQRIRREEAVLYEEYEKISR